MCWQQAEKLMNYGLFLLSINLWLKLDVLFVTSSKRTFSGVLVLFLEELKPLCMFPCVVLKGSPKKFFGLLRQNWPLTYFGSHASILEQEHPFQPEGKTCWSKRLIFNWTFSRKTFATMSPPTQRAKSSFWRWGMHFDTRPVLFEQKLLTFFFEKPWRKYGCFFGGKNWTICLCFFALK